MHGRLFAYDGLFSLSKICMTNLCLMKSISKGCNVDRGLDQLDSKVAQLRGNGLTVLVFRLNDGAQVNSVRWMLREKGVIAAVLHCCSACFAVVASVHE